MARLGGLTETRSGQGTGGERPAVRAGSERQPRRSEVYREGRPRVFIFHHQLLQGRDLQAQHARVRLPSHSGIFMSLFTFLIPPSRL